MYSRITPFPIKYITIYMIGHYNPSVRIIDLVFQYKFYNTKETNFSQRGELVVESRIEMYF